MDITADQVVTVDHLKRLAKQIKLSTGMIHMHSLEEAARQCGFKTYNGARDILPLNLAEIHDDANNILQDDDLISSDDMWDARNHSWEFMRGFADEALGKEPNTAGMSMAEAGAYKVGRSEAKIRKYPRGEPT